MFIVANIAIRRVWDWAWASICCCLCWSKSCSCICACLVSLASILFSSKFSCSLWSAISSFISSVGVSLFIFRYSIGSFPLLLLFLRLIIFFVLSNIFSSFLSAWCIGLFLMANAFSCSLSDFLLSLVAHGLMRLEVMTYWISSRILSTSLKSSGHFLLLLHISIEITEKVVKPPLLIFDPLALQWSGVSREIYCSCNLWPLLDCFLATNPFHIRFVLPRFS